MLFLLQEYRQSVDNKSDCLARMIEFMGVDRDRVDPDFDGDHGRYWLM